MWGFKSPLAHQLRSYWTATTPTARTATMQDRLRRQLTPRLGAGVLFPKRLGYSSKFATLAVELLANS